MKKMINTKMYSDTNINEVKKLNAESGLSYNEVFALLAQKYNEQNQNQASPRKK